MFDSIEKAFNQMTLFTKPPVKIPGFFSIWLWRNCIGRILCSDISSDLFSSISFITQDIGIFDINVCQQTNCSGIIANLAALKFKVNRISQRVNLCVNSSCVTTPTFTDVLIHFFIYSPFLALALC